MDLKTLQTSLSWWVNWWMRNLWKAEEEGMERKRATSASIIFPLLHYRSRSEGWWRVGQFPQTPSGCPWKWQIVRLIVLGSWPFRGNEPLYLEQKSIKALHSQTALALFGSSEGWLWSSWEASQTSLNEYSSYSIRHGNKPGNYIKGHENSISKPATRQERYIFSPKLSGNKLHFIFCLL